MNTARKLQLLFAACACAASGLLAREGWELKAYPDPVLGNRLPTACAGVTEGIIPNATYTEAECLQRTAEAMVKHAGPILPCMRDDIPADAAPFLGEMVTLSYNIGQAGFRNSSMCRQMLAGNYRGACDAILLWYRSDGLDCRTDRRCRGLWLDRQRQHARCIEDLQ